MRSQQDWPPAPLGGARSDALPGETRPEASRNLVFQNLAHSRRRQVLRLLLDRSAPMPEPAIAAIVAAVEVGAVDDADAAADRDSLDVGSDAVERIRVGLRNRHLPALDEADLVDWDAEAEVVRPTDHPALEDDAIRRVVTSDVRVADVFDAIANERRRLVLAVLYTYGGPVEASTVAEKVADLEETGEDVRDVQISLRHTHLPKLDDAGLVRWIDDERVRYVDHPDVEERWFTF